MRIAPGEHHIPSVSFLHRHFLSFVLRKTSLNGGSKQVKVKDVIRKLFDHSDEWGGPKFPSYDVRCEGAPQLGYIIENAGRMFSGPRSLGSPALGTATAVHAAGADTGATIAISTALTHQDVPRNVTATTT